jgi:DNA-binding response OmpR family regulator
VVREALKAHCVRCVIQPVPDGEQALKLINSDESRVDLFILDMHLPKHDGEEILTCLRAIKRYARTPVIMMTALESSMARATAARNPTMVYFPKPSTLERIHGAWSNRRCFARTGSSTRRNSENDYGNQ